MIIVLDRPSIELIPIEIDYDKSVNDGADIDYNTEQIGKYPYVYINNIIVESQSIKVLKLYNNKVLPNLEMEFTDSTSKIIDENYPLDDSKVSIFINANNEDLMPVRMDFKITEFATDKTTKGSTIIFKIKADLDVDGLYLNAFESNDGSSFDVLRNMCKELTIGFASNVQGTNDSMKWLNIADYKINHMKDIVAHSYISDDTFLFGYIDFYYNYNYVDIETALEEDISEQNNILDNTKAKKDGDEQILPLILTNNPDKDSTNMFISKYLIDNNTTKINIEESYNNNVMVYDKLNMKYNGYLLDTISSVGDNDGIILKGNGQDSSVLYDEQKKNIWTGKIDKDNVHENYSYCEVQNEKNLNFLQKIKMVIELPKPNFNLYRFQKVTVELYNFGKNENNKQDGSKNDRNVQEQKKNQYEDKIINKLSGEWLITAINYTFDRLSGNKQEVTLTKRELTSKYVFKKK